MRHVDPILQESVPSLGEAGDLVKVKVGFAPKSGILELILDSGDGPAGAADLKILVKTPKNGQAIAR